MAIAVTLYLYDVIILLYSNEAILSYDHRSSWTLHAGWRGFVLGGRTLCVLNPFTPHQTAFRLTWNFEESGSKGGDHNWSDRAKRFRTVGALSFVAGIALFVMLPLGLFTKLGPNLILAAVVLLYPTIFAALVLVYRRQLFGRGGQRSFFAFAFECLACPPFAINMIRRLTLRDKILEPFPLAAFRLMTADRWVCAQQYCISRLEESLRTMDPVAPAHGIVMQHIAELQARSPK